MRAISKRILSLFLIILLILSAFPFSFVVYAEEYKDKLGDVNRDGQISIEDATIVQEYLAELETLDLASSYLAAVDTKQGVSICDVTMIQMYLADCDMTYPKNQEDIQIGDELNFELTCGFLTKNKVYGISFETDSNSSLCTRIEDAKNLSNNYTVGNEFQNSGENDFDAVYPWCEIKRCNLIVNDDGTKTITYEGEEGFALDGSNGSVMVEIPKFYSAREVSNGVESWAITGTKKTGFQIEPAFLNNQGEELSHIYIGAYEFTNNNSQSHSASGLPVATTLWMSQYRSLAEKDNLTCMDYATLHAIQMLYTIEFADRDTDKYMQGYSEGTFFQYNNNPITSISEDRKTVTLNYTNSRTKKLRAGQSVSISQNTAIKQENLKIIAIEITDDVATITLDTPITSAITNITAGNYYLAGQGQPTGLCDEIQYHTGRQNAENSISTFKYRHIENIWGNVWTLIEGLRIKGLNYYYTYDTTEYADTTIDRWDNSHITAPNQPYLGDDGLNRAWIAQMGYNPALPLITLPTATIQTPNSGDYFSSGIYTNYDVDRNGKVLNPADIYVCTYGGGYDHNTLCGLFTMRFWFKIGNEVAALHSSRVVCRQ